MRAVQGIAPLPDGSVVLGEKQRLIRYDAAGRRVADLGPGVGPSASPDGKRLALVVSDDFMRQIWVMNLDGSERKQLTTSDGYNVSPGWSPDGSTILYTNFAPGAADADTPESWLETVAADGGQPARLTSTKLDLIGRYSPDGSWIAFMSERDRVKDDCGNRQCFFDYLYVMRADGSDAHRVTRDPLFDAPVFATATTIVYGRHADGYDELYRIELDGSCRARITRDVLLDEEAAVPPGEVPASGCIPATPPRELPAGPNYDGSESSISIAGAAKRRGMALYWLGESMAPFALATITIDDPSRHDLKEPVHLYYRCLPDGDDCSRRVWITMSPVCSRPTIWGTRKYTIDRFRGVPRVRYSNSDDLITGTTVINVSSDRVEDRERAERQLRSLNAPRGRIGPGVRLPAPPKDVLAGLRCQKP